MVLISSRQRFLRLILLKPKPKQMSGFALKACHKMVYANSRSCFISIGMLPTSLKIHILHSVHYLTAANMRRHDAKRLTTKIILFIFFFLLFFIPFSLSLVSKNQPRKTVVIPTPTMKQPQITILLIIIVSPTSGNPPISQPQSQISPAQDPQTRLLEKI